MSRGRCIFLTALAYNERTSIMSPTRYLRTSELAKAANIHPNTVRLYEQWGLIQPTERNPFNNYRRFTQKHLDQVLRYTLLGGNIRTTIYDIIAQGKQDNLGGALELAYKLLSQIQAERAQAE